MTIASRSFVVAFLSLVMSPACASWAQDQPAPEAVKPRPMVPEVWTAVRNEVVRRNEFETEKYKRQMAETKERQKERARQAQAFDDYQRKETEVIAALAQEVEELRAANDPAKLAEREKELNRRRRELSDRTVEWQRDQR